MYDFIPFEAFPSIMFNGKLFHANRLAALAPPRGSATFSSLLDDKIPSMQYN
jgi:hypothetical protein